PGVFDEKHYLYYATDLEFNKQKPDENEIIDYLEYNITEIFERIAKGEINDAKTICALHRALGYIQ
ncbi:NUDIX hydrolase, partial [bacterium]|nr:NUDIX hydrolase [bacterium]